MGGLRSDMTGTKAVFLQDWAAARGLAYLRFDYTGHGESSGRFEDTTIADWSQDAVDAITALTEGPQILVGSSMGGWAALAAARVIPERIAGFVGVAAAPDFTEDLMWAGMSAEERAALQRDGRIEQPNDYSDEPYIITRDLIEAGRRCLILRDPYKLDAPMRLVHGTDDADVPLSVALKLLSHAECPDARLTLIKGAGHRLSDPAELTAIAQAVDEVLQARR